MADIVDAATRSRMMSGIRSKNTTPERLVRSLLHRNGFRYRLHAKTLSGKPDIVLPRYHAVIFVNGCFWHGHQCSLFRMPGTRTEFWKGKFETNRTRDRRNVEQLSLAGWRVAIVWECAVRGSGAISNETLTQTLTDWLNSDKLMLDISANNGRSEK